MKNTVRCVSIRSIGAHTWATIGTSTYDYKVSKSTLATLGEKIAQYPEEHKLNSRVAKVYQERMKMAKGDKPMDWGFAETLAYATLFDKGIHIRLTGQDSGRGTFFHRHAVLHNQKDASTYMPLNHIKDDQGANRNL